MLTSSNMTSIIYFLICKTFQEYDKKYFRLTVVSATSAPTIKDQYYRKQTSPGATKTFVKRAFCFLNPVFSRDEKCHVTAIRFSYSALLTHTHTHTHTHRKTNTVFTEVQRSVLFYHFTLFSATCFGSFEPSSGMIKYKRKYA
jgi:hypothetical protein